MVGHKYAPIGKVIIPGYGHEGGGHEGVDTPAQPLLDLSTDVPLPFIRRLLHLKTKVKVKTLKILGSKCIFF